MFVLQTNEGARQRNCRLTNTCSLTTSTLRHLVYDRHDERLFARTRSFSLVDGVARNHRHPIETARLRGIGGGSSARLSAGCRGVTGPHPVALAFASDWLLQATLMHHFNTYTSITATKAALF